MNEHVCNHDDFMNEHVYNHNDFMSEHDFMGDHVYILECHIDLNVMRYI